MDTNPRTAREALTWLRDGYLGVVHEPARWLAMTLVYLVIALLLKRIPFLGNFVLVLITPIMFAGALLAARAPATPAMRILDLVRLLTEMLMTLGGFLALLWYLAIGGDWQRIAIAAALLGLPMVDSMFRAFLGDGMRDLFHVFRRKEYTLVVVIVCIVTLGLVVLVAVPELLITGGSVASGLVGINLAGPLRPSVLAGIGVVGALYVLLAMGLFYLVPLTLFGNRQPVAAVVESFRACLRQGMALVLFVTPFLVINGAILVGFARSHLLGYGLLVALGMVSLPAFVIGLHASYRALFESSRAAP